MGGLKKILQVTFILLLVIKTSLNCGNFEQLTITSYYKEHIETLRSYSLLDYSSETITNLKEDSLCSNIWNLYFYERELERLYNVSGDKLKTIVKDVRQHLSFITKCTFDVSKHCEIKRNTNIAVFLDNVNSTMTKMKDNLPIDLSNCSEIQCIEDAVTEPINKTSDLPDKGNRKSDKPKEERRQYWLWVSIVLVSIFSIAITISIVRYRIKHPRRSCHPIDLESGERPTTEDHPLKAQHADEATGEEISGS